MAHKLNRLTSRAVATASKPGLYADGGGLYLRVGRGGAKSWCLRYMLEGKAREMGLGGLATRLIATRLVKAWEKQDHLRVELRVSKPAPHDAPRPGSKGG